MDTYKICRQALKEKWYIQGFNGLPVFLNSAAYSGLLIEKELGFSYQKYFLDYQGDYCEVGYLQSDLDNIWRAVKKELTRDHNYLQKVKRGYNETFRSYENLFASIGSSQLKKLIDSELVAKIKNCKLALIDSVGISHIIEAVGMGLEKDFKKQLRQAIRPDEKFNQYLTVLTTPTQPSFINQEEHELSKMAQLKENEQEDKLAEHANKYFWISNSYAKVRELSGKYFARRLNSARNKQEGSSAKLEKEQASIIKKLNLSEEAIFFIDLIDFVTIWQDKRKANILKAIGYMNRVVNEISCRTKISKKLLYYLGVKDVEKINSLTDLTQLKDELTERSQDVFFLQTEAEEYALSGQPYLDLQRYRDKLEGETKLSERELHGSVAMTGTAVGRVVVCKGSSSLAKVKKGDIIIASMTRPEFMPALKKAAGIVTDEGGITCHAAIVARELNIPTVIGTKRATKVFRDGMQIEVRANHGIVRELK